MASLDISVAIFYSDRLRIKNGALVVKFTFSSIESRITWCCKYRIENSFTKIITIYWQAALIDLNMYGWWSSGQKSLFTFFRCPVICGSEYSLTVKAITFPIVYTAIILETLNNLFNIVCWSEFHHFGFQPSSELAKFCINPWKTSVGTSVTPTNQALKFTVTYERSSWIALARVFDRSGMNYYII